MEAVIDWEVVSKQLDSMLYGSPHCLGLGVLLSHRGEEGHDLTAHVWVDNGVRDEEGVPTEFEPPAVYITLSVRFLGHWRRKVHNLPPAEVPIIAAVLKPQIEAAKAEAWHQVNEWCDRFKAIVSQLKNQRSKVLKLKGEGS